MTNAWTCVCDATTTRDELAPIIETWIHAELVSVLEQLFEQGIGARDRIAALALVEPVIRAQTATALRAGWQRLQVDAAAGSIH